MLTISDKRIQTQDSANLGNVLYYSADVVTANDYYPGGMLMPGRKFSQLNSSYRYGFNCKELDKESLGTTTYDYGFRIYSPALGRFLSTDSVSKEYPWYTPYQFAGNKPIWAIDLDGLEEYLVMNCYDKKGCVEETVITMINVKAGGREEMKLQDADGGYLAKKKVLIRNVQPNGHTTYNHRKQLKPEQALIVAKATKELIAPKVSPFALEGGRGTGENGKVNDGGDFYSTERDDYTNDKYQAVGYRKVNTFLPDVIKANRDFAIISLNAENDIMKNSEGRDVYNGKVEKFSNDLAALPGQIKRDNKIKSIDVTLVWDVGENIDGQNLDVIKRGDCSNWPGCKESFIKEWS